MEKTASSCSLYGRHSDELARWERPIRRANLHPQGGTDKRAKAARERHKQRATRTTSETNGKRGCETTLKTPNPQRQDERKTEDEKMRIETGHRSEIDTKGEKGGSRTTRDVARTRRTPQRYYRGLVGAGCKGFRQMGLRRDNMYREPLPTKMQVPVATTDATATSLQNVRRPIRRATLHPQGGAKGEDKGSKGRAQAADNEKDQRDQRKQWKRNHSKNTQV